MVLMISRRFFFFCWCATSGPSTLKAVNLSDDQKWVKISVHNHHSFGQLRINFRTALGVSAIVVTSDPDLPLSWSLMFIPRGALHFVQSRATYRRFVSMLCNRNKLSHIRPYACKFISICLNLIFANLQLSNCFCAAKFTRTPTKITSFTRYRNNADTRDSRTSVGGMKQP